MHVGTCREKRGPLLELQAAVINICICLQVYPDVRAWKLLIYFYQVASGMFVWRWNKKQVHLTPGGVLLMIRSHWFLGHGNNNITGHG